eukprot:15340819-Ditylum_brightwellii.AAC.1
MVFAVFLVAVAMAFLVLANCLSAAVADCYLLITNSQEICRKTAKEMERQQGCLAAVVDCPFSADVFFFVFHAVGKDPFLCVDAHMRKMVSLFSRNIVSSLVLDQKSYNNIRRARH